MKEFESSIRFEYHLAKKSSRNQIILDRYHKYDLYELILYNLVSSRGLRIG